MIVSGMTCFACCRVPYRDKFVNTRRYQYCTLKILLWIAIRYVYNVIEKNLVSILFEDSLLSGFIRSQKLLTLLSGVATMGTLR